MQIAAELEYSIKKESPFGLSFPSIIACAKNATVLHYIKNDALLPKNGLLLMDFGAKWGTQSADVTRTLPLSGKYNALERLLMSLVLDVMSFNEQNAGPGKTIKELNDSAWSFLESELQKRFFDKGGKAKRDYQARPHGISHLIGEQVHEGDPWRLYHTKPLQEGQIISNEPGIYGHFQIKIGTRLYNQWIGIRIEDDLMITQKGCQNLTKKIPKDLSQIEKLIGIGNKP